MNFVHGLHKKLACVQLLRHYKMHSFLISHLFFFLFDGILPAPSLEHYLLSYLFFFFLAHPLLPRFHFSHYSQQSFKDVVFLATDNKQKKIVESSLKKKKKEHVLYHFIMDAATTCKPGSTFFLFATGMIGGGGMIIASVLLTSQAVDG